MWHCSCGPAGDNGLQEVSVCLFHKRHFHKHKELTIMALIFIYLQFLSLFVTHDVSKCKVSVGKRDYISRL